MKKIIFTLGLIGFLFTSCGDNGKKAEQATANKTTDSTAIAEKPLLALADFDSNAGKWINKEVKVEGIVDHVCKHGGKKLLLVNDEADVHVESEERFDDALVGSEILVTGIVKEFRVDEAYCLQKEEDHQQSHKDGTDSDEMYAKKMEQITFFRDSMKAAKVDHLSFYSLDYISHKIEKEAEKATEEKKESKE